MELSYLYRGRLLVVMPNGYGIYRGGRPLERERRAVLKLAAPGSADSSDLVGRGMTAVQRLAALEGHKLALPSGADEGKKGSSAPIAVIAIGSTLGTLLVAMSALVLVRWRSIRRARATSA
jgi:hypothetical protein